jgi:hypothetical protein
MADAAATPAPARKGATPAPAKTDREKQLEAELGAVRSQLAQAQDAARLERRSSDPRSAHYDPAAAQEEA